MAHLVFMHGINNEKWYPSEIARDWWSALVEGWEKHDFGPIPEKPRITTGYYAQRLYVACHGKPYLTEDPNNELPKLDLDTLVAMGAEGFDSTGNGIGLLQEYAAEAGLVIPSEEVQEQGIVRRGLIKLGDWLEERLPSDVAKTIASGFLGQAAVYCDDAGLRRGIERQVMGQISGVTDPIEPIDRLDDEPLILVTHSMGTVVGYRMLFSAAAAASDIPLFVTLGSPLNLKFIKKSLDQPRLKYPKPPVDKWVNAHDKEDFVALGDSLSEKHIGFPGVENHATKEYKAGDGRHDIGPHLKTREVSQAIYNALSGA